MIEIQGCVPVGNPKYEFPTGEGVKPISITIGEGYNWYTFSSGNASPLGHVPSNSALLMYWFVVPITPKIYV